MDGHLSQLGDGLWKLRRDGLLTDVGILCEEGEPVKAHSLVLLAAGGPYFGCALGSDWRAGLERGADGTPLLRLGCERAVTLRVLEWIYTGNVAEGSDWDGLLVDAHMLGIEGLVEMCCDRLIQDMEPEDVFWVGRIARSLGLRDLEERTYGYAAANIGRLQFPQDADPSHLASLLSSEEFSCDEGLLLKKALAWLAGRTPEERAEVLSAVRIGNVGKRAVLRAGLVRGASEMLRRGQGRKTLVFVGGATSVLYCRESAVADFVAMTDKGWRYLQEMPAKLRGHASVVAPAGGETLYVTGGSGQETVSAKCFRYDAGRDEWTEISPMANPREDHCACLLDGRIYVVGGTEDDCPVTAVERYSPGEDRWETLGDCPCPIIGAACCAGGDGKLYVSGGSNPEFDYFGNGRVMWGYDPIEESWTVYSPPPRHRRDHTMLPGPHNTLLLYGGLCMSSMADVFDIGAGRWRSWEMDQVYRELSGRREPSMEIDGTLYHTGAAGSSPFVYSMTETGWQRMRDRPQSYTFHSPLLAMTVSAHSLGLSRGLQSPKRKREEDE